MYRNGIHLLPETSERQLSSIYGETDRLDVTPLSGNRWLTDGIWRIASAERSVVLKHVTADPGGDTSPWGMHWTYRSDIETHWNYWRREFLAYRSEIPALFGSAGLRSPDLIAYEDGGNYVDLWLEECTAPAVTTWSPQQYIDAARLLGTTQGRLTAQGLVPEHSWFCRNYIGDYQSEKPFDFSIVFDDSAWQVPLIEDNFSIALRQRLRNFVDTRSELHEILASVPVTLCHNDFWTRNLFGDTAAISVIDWSFVGAGPLGSDIANLVLSAGFDGFIEPHDLPGFASSVFDGYSAGLVSGGWNGDTPAARLGMWCSAVKYVWVVPGILRSAADPTHPIYVGYGGASFDAHVSRVATTLGHAVDWIENALTS
ncbi:phosphotransferase [Nocardia sp. NPDC052112]|uniref:phosphotransferase n=1 Tax=Nocardia sp. NPDC052112 TaxID=3155646 RepID=UPI003443CAB0